MASSRDQLLQSAEKYVAKGKLDQALKDYLRVLEENPKDIATLNRVGDLALIEPKAFGLGLESQRGVKAMRAVGCVSLVRQKLNFIATSRSGVFQHSAHDARRDPLAPIGECHHHSFNERRRRAPISEVRHDQQRRGSHRIAIYLREVDRQIRRGHHACPCLLLDLRRGAGKDSTLIALRVHPKQRH